MQICMMAVKRTTADVLAGAGPRLRALRRARGATLANLADETGLTPSTLSRLETGRVRPTLEQLLPLARAHGVSIDELVQAPQTGDPRINLRPVRRFGLTIVPLALRPGGVQVYKAVYPPAGRESTLAPQSHEGYQMFYVLDGAVRFVLGDQDFRMSPGEAADFDTRVPHWIGSADSRPAELLMLFGPQGERAYLTPVPPPARDDEELCCIAQPVSEHLPAPGRNRRTSAGDRADSFVATAPGNFDP